MQDMDNSMGLGNTDLPIGLGMQLAGNAGAMDAYAKLSDGQKTELVKYIQSAPTGDESLRRITETVQRLAGA